MFWILQPDHEYKIAMFRHRFFMHIYADMFKIIALTSFKKYKAKQLEKKSHTFDLLPMASKH